MQSTRTKKQSYLIEGMSCSGCERTVSKVVASIDGITASQADLNSSSLYVEYDPSKVSIDKIKSAVKGVGYKFVGDLPVSGQREGSDEAIP